MTDQTFPKSEARTLPQQPKVIAENVSFEDFVQQYDGQPVEWHAGKVVETVSNNKTHQTLFLFLSTLLNLYLGLTDKGELHPDGYPMFISPDKPARQPDLLVVLNENQAQSKENYLDGAADLVVEIVSPSSSAVDRGEKFEEYEQAGVKEYWIVDPIRNEVIVYALNDNGYYNTYEPDTAMLTSKLLEGFEISLSMLWSNERPKGSELIKLAQQLANQAKAK